MAQSDCTALPSTLSPTSGNVRTLGSYVEVGATAAGTAYHVCVTGVGDRSDLRLDLPAVKLKDQQITTLVLTATPGGVLVNGVQIDQGGTVAPYPNSSARVRLVADAANQGTVTASVGGRSLANAIASPVVGGYALVPAGTPTASVEINRTALPAVSLTAAPGADLTLLVAGTAADPKIRLITDNNRPSTAPDKPVKLRVVNGVNGLNGLAGGVTLLDNLFPYATSVPFGEASTPANVPASTATVIEVTSASPVVVNGTPTTSVLRLSGDNAVTLVAGRVYSVFVLGDTTNPSGVLRQDR